jgi:hypothetical protein
MSKIGALIKELAKTNDELYSQVCTVTSVDKSARTVNVEPINETLSYLMSCFRQILILVRAFAQFQRRAATL